MPQYCDVITALNSTGWQNLLVYKHFSEEEVLRTMSRGDFAEQTYTKLVRS